MKTSMKYISRTAAIGVILALMLLTGCGSDTTGSISGKILDSTGEPVPSVTVMLIDNAFKPYTSLAEGLAEFGSYSAMNAYNEQAFVATAITDANGAYNMLDIIAGNYTLAPIPSVRGQSFTPTTGSNPATVSVNENASIVDFVSEVLVMGSRTFNIAVTFKNLKDVPDPELRVGNPKFTIGMQRQAWIGLLPMMTDKNQLPGMALLNTSTNYGTVGPLQVVQLDTGVTLDVSSIDVGSTPPTVTFTYSYGYTAVVFSVGDYFAVTVYSGTSWTKLSGDYFPSPPFGFVLGTTPANSAFTYDCATNKITRTM